MSHQAFDPALSFVSKRAEANGTSAHRVRAAKLKAGENTLTLTVPAGPVNNGVIYDYLRLEL